MIQGTICNPQTPVHILVHNISDCLQTSTTDLFGWTKKIKTFQVSLYETWGGNFVWIYDNLSEFMRHDIDSEVFSVYGYWNATLQPLYRDDMRGDMRGVRAWWHD